MTEKLTPFQQSVKDAERRARRKVKRLEKKGVNTRGIAPLQDQSQMTPQARRAYKQKLEGFISRQNRIIPGYEGAPIHYDVVKQIRAAERELNKTRERQWKTVRSKGMLEQPDLSAGEFRSYTETFDPATGQLKPNPKSPLYFTEARNRDLSLIKSEKQAREYIKKMKHAATKGYQKQRMQQLRKNAAEVVVNLNEPRLAKRIRKLSDRQLYELMTRSQFLATVFSNSKPLPGAEIEGFVDYVDKVMTGVGG